MMLQQHARDTRTKISAEILPPFGADILSMVSVPLAIHLAIGLNFTSTKALTNVVEF